ncbi:MAG: glycine--tRNA ligase subunit beta [Candidatus Omnitrophica bacterium]|nr:glycine--tRNA ligase subunit beta [Candidatus Omnitrophota bacterium]
MSNTTKTLLLEIGCEEIPADYMPDALAQIRNLAQQYLEEELLEYGDIQVLGTPRRLVLHVRGLAVRQKDRAMRREGPPKERAYDAEGKLTRAGQGFCEGLGIKADCLSLEEVKGKAKVVAHWTRKGASAATVLKVLLPRLISELKFPKMMRWDDTGVRFARPVRWILALLGETPLVFTWGRVKAGARSLSPRYSGSKPFGVKSPADYFRQVKQKGILLDPEERRQKIARQLDVAAKKAGGILHKDEGLLQEISFLVEDPSVLTGGFDPDYAERLPLDVLSAAMAKGQRLFGILHASKSRRLKPLPKFIGVLNGPRPAEARQAIRRNCENILNAKLADARFFFLEDTKRGMDFFASLLPGIVFLRGAGTMAEKTGRIRNLARYLHQQVDSIEYTEEELEQAVSWCKADLASQMVKEFPALQGVIGGVYAGEQGASPKVCVAIGEHYFPRSAEDRLPQTVFGSILSVADKLDSVAQCFRVGLKPTSSGDPYGIRRNVQGALQIVLERGWNLRLSELLQIAAGDGDPAALERTAEYCMARLQVLLKLRYPDAWVDAVFPLCGDRPQELVQRLDQLQEIPSKYFRDAAKIVERAHRIVRAGGEVESEVQPQLFEHQLEHQVWDVCLQQEGVVENLTRNQQYGEATRQYAEAFSDLLHEFFDQVMVNVEQAEVRANRLSLMKRVYDIFASRIADLSVVHVE